MKSITFPNNNLVAQQAASMIAYYAREAISKRGKFCFALSGGRTPWLMLDALAKEQLPWDKVHIFQVDERVAPAGDPSRNLTHLQETLLKNSPLSAENVHPMPVEKVACNKISLEEAALDYAATIELHLGKPARFDLIHLGLGADGHTASLVPGDPSLQVLHQEVTKAGPYQDRMRMTLTYPIINRARNILWVVTGAEKADALEQLLHADHSIPGGPIAQENALVLSDITLEKVEQKLDEKILKIGIAADHGGLALKKEIIEKLYFYGFEVSDFGAYKQTAGDDYPDYVTPLAHAVASGEVERGIALCGSGVGASVCANKVAGVRAALLHDHFSVKQGVEDDHINVISLGGRTFGTEVAWELIYTFLTSHYSDATRHQRRLAKVAQLEGKIK